MSNEYLNRLITVVSNPGAISTPQLKHKIRNEFGVPFFQRKNGKTYNITTNGRKHIINLFKQEQNVYNTVIELLNTHLNWLFIYCNDTFVDISSNEEPAVNAIETKEQIREKIKEYMKQKHKFTNECNDENLGIRDLISYDTENMSEKLQTVYMFMSLFRITQSGKKHINHKKNYCILLNEFINNLTTLLEDSNNKILTKTTKIILFSPEIVTVKHEENLKSFKNINSPNIKTYGRFILNNIINKLFKNNESE